MRLRNIPGAREEMLVNPFVVQNPQELKGHWKQWFAEEKGIELDKRDVEQQAPYDELCALGGDANKIPYIHHDGQLVQGVEACNALLAAL